MRRAVLLMAAMGVALLLTTGVVEAQEEPLPDLTVEKSGPKVITAGETATYTIVVTNVGTGNAIIPPGDGNIQTSPTLVQDELRFSGRSELLSFASNGPAGLSGLYGTASGGSKDTFTVEIGHVDRDQADVIIPGATVTLFISPTPGGPGIIRDCATVDPDNVVRESNENNNTQCLTTRVMPEEAS